MEIEKKRFREMFPHLAEELEGEEHVTPITSVRSDIQTGEKASSKKFVSYMPDVIDFIRRCDNDQQAKEIINFLEKRGEVNREYARRLRRQLKEKGVRSFGSKKEEDYYSKQSDL
ncbi:MAG: DUF2095 family protein [Candidatus Bathyarchaeia archaeon]